MTYVLDISNDPFQGVFGDARGLNQEEYASTLSLEELIWSQERHGPIALKAESAVQELLSEIAAGDNSRYVELLHETAPTYITGGWRKLYPHAVTLVNGSITCRLEDHLKHIQFCVEKLHHIIGFEQSAYSLSSMVEDNLHSRAFICIEEDGIDAFYNRFAKEDAESCFGEVMGSVLQENAFNVLYAVQGHNRDPLYLDAQHWQGLAKSFYCSQEDLLKTGLKRMQNTLDQFTEEETLLAYIKDPVKRQAVKLKQGMGGNREHNLIQVGMKLGITRERTRVLYSDAVEELRNSPEMLAKFVSGA